MPIARCSNRCCRPCDRSCNDSAMSTDARIGSSIPSLRGNGPPMSNARDETPEACRTMARQQALRGDRGAAEKSFLRLLERHPRDVEALRFVADCQSARGEHAAAMQSLQAVTRVAPEDPAAWVQLAATQMTADDLGGAVASFGHGLALAPRMFVPRLQLGIALEQLGRTHDALRAYFMAIESAHGMGRWQDDATTAPGLRDAVKHAVDYVNRERRALFRCALDPLRERYG